MESLLLFWFFNCILNEGLFPDEQRPLTIRQIEREENAKLLSYPCTSTQQAV
jgi:hypothetical protein